MAWTETIRPKYARDPAGYQSDLTDAEWRLLEPLLVGQLRKWPLRPAIEESTLRNPA